MKAMWILAGLGGGFLAGQYLAKRQFATELAAPPPIGSKAEVIAAYNQRLAQRGQTAQQWGTYGALIGGAGALLLK